MLNDLPCSSLPRLLERFVLDTDASDCEIGAVLSQVNDDMSECVIAYASHSLIRQER